MSKRRRSVFSRLPLLFFGVALAASCLSKGGKLTREMAQEKLSRAFDCLVVLFLPEGKITDHFQLDMPMPSLKAAQESAEVLRGLEKESKTIRLLSSLSEASFISFAYSSPRILFDPKARTQPLRAAYDIQIFLTEKGKECLLAEPPEDAPFSLTLKYFLLSPVHEKVFSEAFTGEFTVSCLKLCEKVVSKVERIRRTGRSEALVDFQWKFDRFTSLGEFIGRDFEWTFQEGFFAVVALHPERSVRVVDLLDSRVNARESARLILEGGSWRVEQDKKL